MSFILFSWGRKEQLLIIKVILWCFFTMLWSNPWRTRQDQEPSSFFATCTYKVRKKKLSLISHQRLAFLSQKRSEIGENCQDWTKKQERQRCWSKNKKQFLDIYQRGNWKVCKYGIITSELTSLILVTKSLLKNKWTKVIERLSK